MATTANMSLTTWPNLSDLFNHTQLKNNFTTIDTHDHSTGQGRQIPTGGLQNFGVTNVKLADGAVTTAKITDGQVTNAKLAAPEAPHTVGAGGEPVLTAGWTTTAFRFYKHASRVFICGAGTWTGSNGTTTVFTLPAGYAPGGAFTPRFLITAGTSTVGFATISAAGVVAVVSAVSGTTYSFDNIHFLAEN